MKSESETEYFYIKKGKTFFNVNKQMTISQLRDMLKPEKVSWELKCQELYIMNYHINRFFDPLEASIFYSIFNTNVIESKDIRKYSKSSLKIEKEEEYRLEVKKLLNLLTNFEEDISQKENEILELDEIEKELEKELHNLEKSDVNQQKLESKENKVIAKHNHLLNKFINKSEAYRFKLEIFLQYKKMKDNGYQIIKKNEILVHRLEKINITLSYLEEKFKTFKENEAICYRRVQNEKKNLDMYLPNQEIKKKYFNASFNYSVILNFARIQKSKKVSLIYNTNSYFVLFSRFESDNKSFVLKQRHFEFNEEFQNDINRTHLSHVLTLNILNKLLIIIGNNSYYLDVETGKVSSISNNLHDNHLFGSLVYLVKHNTILCISGKITEKCEMMILENLKLEPKLMWSKIESLSKSRAHSCTFVVNGSEVYCLFGYNYSEDHYFDYIEKINFDSSKRNWIKINIISSPFYKNILSATISINNNTFYIYGGIIDGKINNKIYVFFVDKLKVELTKLSVNIKYDEKFCLSNPNNLNESTCSELMFYNESNFVALSPEENFKKSLFNFVIYDNKRYYILNILNNTQYVFIINNHIKEKKEINEISEISENSFSSEDVDEGEEVKENIQSNEFVIKNFQFENSNY